jgi:hypothetical protein
VTAPAQGGDMTTEALQLDPGEQLLWSGRPVPMWFAMRRAWRPLLMAIVFLALFVVYLVELNRVPPRIDPILDHVTMVGQIVFAIVTGLLSFCSVLAALWMWQRAYRTTYYLTNRRVVIDIASLIARRTSMPLEHLRFIELQSRLLGPSDLIFSESWRFNLVGWGLRGEGFIAILEASRVEGLVRAAIDQTFTMRTRGPWQ